MPLPKGYLLREGDEILILAKVKYAVDPDEDHVHCRAVGANHTNVMIPLANVFGLHRRTWEVGERVRVPDPPNGVGDVMAVCEDKVWVRLPEIGFMTFDANELEAVPVEPTPEIPPAPEPEPLDPARL